MSVNCASDGPMILRRAADVRGPGLLVEGRFFGDRYASDHLLKTRAILSEVVQEPCRESRQLKWTASSLQRLREYCSEFGDPLQVRRQWAAPQNLVHLK